MWNTGAFRGLLRLENNFAELLLEQTGQVQAVVVALMYLQSELTATQLRSPSSKLLKCMYLQ